MTVADRTFSGSVLSADEARALTDRIKGTVTATWALLLEAYEREAWKALGHGTWESYVSAEFTISRSHAYRILDHGRVVRELVGPSGSMSRIRDTPPNIEQAGELAPLLPDPDAMREVYTEAVERTEGKPTAAVIREVRKERSECEAKATPEPRQAPRPQLPTSSLGLFTI